jgi:transposase-like protein
MGYQERRWYPSSERGTPMPKHRQFSPQFKVESVLELLRGRKTQAQICRERQRGADLLSYWREEFLRRAPNSLDQPTVGTLIGVIPIS